MLMIDFHRELRTQTEFYKNETNHARFQQTKIFYCIKKYTNINNTNKHIIIKYIAYE